MARTKDSALRLPALQAVTLARFVLGFVALAAAAGWAASFVGLHGFALAEMHGYTVLTAWLVPGSFDGAAFACSVLVYRASIFGRSALRGRLLMYGFTLLSGWINWHFQSNPLGQWVGAALPFAAVLVFDTVLSDLRAEWEARHGRQAFRLRLGLLGLRWLVDRAGTASAFRATITAVPVTDLVGLGALAGTGNPPAPAEAPTVAPRPYAGPVPPFTTTGTDMVAIVDGTGTERHRYPVPVPAVTEPAPRNPGGTDEPRTEAVPLAPPRATTPGPPQRHPETAAEQTMIIPRYKADDGPETRSKVQPVAQPAASSRRLVSVATALLGKDSSNEALAAAVASSGGMSRRQVMTTYGVGSGRATKIIEMSREVSTDGPQASAR